MKVVKKPELTPKTRSRCRELYNTFKVRPLTKQEVAKMLGTCERTAREMVSEVAKHAPIISTSDTKGYKLATKLCDYEDAKHAWAEIDSRIAELEARKKPLIKFCEKCEQIQRSIQNGN